jgi:hypothetical protein
MAVPTDSLTGPMDELRLALVKEDGEPVAVISHDVIETTDEKRGKDPNDLILRGQLKAGEIVLPTSVQQKPIVWRLDGKKRGWNLEGLGVAELIFH